MKTNAQRQKEWAARHRAAGRVQRKRWAYPEDWPMIDAYIKRMNAKRAKTKPADAESVR